MLDLYHFSFNVIDQVHMPELPGVWVSTPPKKTSRGREGDLLILFLSLARKTALQNEELNDLLERSAQAYYKSSGSLTAAMRAAAETCNAQLMERNLKSARDEGGQAIGRLNLAVLRGNDLFLAVAGPSHAFVLGSAAFQDCFDPQASRGLGANSAAALRYFQATIQAGDVLVLSPEPPESWSEEALAGSPALTLEHLRRRLLNGIGPNLQAVVFKFQAGSGTVHALRHRSAAPSTMAYAPVEPTVAAGAQPAAAAPAQPAAAPVSQPIEYGAAAPTPAPAPLRPAPAKTPVAAVQPVAPEEEEPAAAPQPNDTAAALEAARLARLRRSERKQKVAAVWAGWKGFNERLGRGWHGLLTRLAPQRAASGGGAAAEPAPRTAVSPLLLVFITIAVPLVVVAIAMTVYLQSGRSQQRETYYEQATRFANQALTQTDPQQQRGTWSQVLQWLDKAEEYGATAESRALRKRAQQGVDAVDTIVRVDFKPVSRVSLPATFQISRLVANGDDLYLLDSSNGSVRRLFFTAQGYELDTKFNCGPGINNSVIVGALVAIAPMPPVNPRNATLAAMDAGGNLLYCIPGKDPDVRTLAPPNVGWGKISHIIIIQETLYVFDALGNAVWRYEGKDLIYKDRPALFSEKFNLSMGNVVDMAMYEDYVYFLRNTGQVIRCTLSKVKEIPTRCDDPAKFSDTRAGRERNPQSMPETRFAQLLAINAPDPSLYILDAQNAAIYRFSVVLNFQDQLRPSGTTDITLPRSEPSAFTITPRRLAFLAYTNQVFMAQMP